jgi:hypothetical protein
MPLTKLQAVEKLKQMCQADVFPVLSNEVLVELIDEFTRSTTWTASTLYYYGNVVQPTSRNGRYYRCIVPGTSSSTEPNFPTNGYSGQVVGDGLDLIWVDYGAAQDETYDVRAACRAAWIRKAGIVANLTDIEDGENKMNLSNVYEQCIKMANLFRPIQVY